MRTRKLLVPLDGSTVSEAALPFAEALALRIGAAVALIRAVHTQSATAISEAENYLERFAERFANRGVTTECGVAFGSAADWIIEEINLRKGDMVVMATHDRSGPDRWVHGSVAEAVISRASVPVVVVRASGRAGVVERFEQPDPVLLVPLDGSELAEAAVPVAMGLAADLGGSLALISVVPHAGQEEEAESYLGQVGNDLVCARVVRQGDPTIEIAAEAAERGATAVVMATHGRAGAMRALLGSVAGQVVHTSQVPVVLVRPATVRGAEEPVARGVAAAGAS